MKLRAAFWDDQNYTLKSFVIMYKIEFIVVPFREGRALRKMARKEQEIS